MRDFAALLQAELDSLAAANRLRICPELTGSSRHHLAGPLVSFASNDYLGLASHPDLAAAAAGAAAIQGFGAGAARLVTGDLPAHRDLETGLAHFLEREAVLSFASGYQANLGVVTALAGPADLIVSDAANHASLIDGCRLSRATIAVYAHADPAAAAACLARTGSFRRRILLTESLFSMDGDVAPLPDLATLAARHDAILVVDEAHALGVLGPSGRGLCAAAGVHPDVLVGTLGKAFGAAGGFVAGSTALRSYLVNRARTFVFATAPPPPLAAAARAALQLAAGPEGDRRRAQLAANCELLLQHLEAPELRVRDLSQQRPTYGGIEATRRPPLRGPIVPVILGTDARAFAAAASLRALGFFVPAIRPPTVPEGTARLRVTLSSEHSAEEVLALARAVRGLP